MALNENLQNVINDLKTAKDNIATAITSKGQPLPKDAGFNDFAGEINNLKPSSYQDVSGVTATESDVLSNKKFVNSSGELKSGTIITQAAKSITPSTSTQTAVAANVYTTGAVTVNPIPSTYVKPSYTKTATTYTPTTTNQTIAAKTYCSGTQTIKGDSNLKAENIKSGVSIFGVNGTMPSGYTTVSGSITTDQTSTLLTISNLPFTSIAGFNFHYMGMNTPSTVAIGGSQVLSFQLYSSYVYFILYVYHQQLGQYVAGGDTIPLASAYNYSNGTLILSTQWIVNNKQINLNFGPQTYNYTIIGN